MATARATASSQLNVRIDSDLKRAGDAVFTSIGLSPSQAVRALWELAARCFVPSRGGSLRSCS